MSEFKIFLFGLGNLGLLIGLILRSWHRVGRHFFYARRAKIKKEIGDAAELIKAAKARAAESSRLASRLPDDLAARKQLIARFAEEESKAALEEAQRRAERIRENAERQGEGEIIAAIADFKRRIVEGAFVRAESILKEEMSAEMKKAAVRKGLGEFSTILPGSLAGLQSGGR
ncbi:MAG: hypothetical protein V2A66_10650 [Pseudomonadota bacterium]